MLTRDSCRHVRDRKCVSSPGYFSFLGYVAQTSLLVLINLIVWMTDETERVKGREREWARICKHPSNSDPVGLSPHGYPKLTGLACPTLSPLLCNVCFKLFPQTMWFKHLTWYVTRQANSSELACLVIYLEAIIAPRWFPTHISYFRIVYHLFPNM